MNRRLLAVAVALCAAGAALALFAASRVWTVSFTPRPAPLAAARTARTGAAIAPWLPALGVVALAGAGALIATRGVARRVVGVLLLAVGLGIVLGAAGRAGWALAATLGGCLVAAAGLLTVVRGHSFPSMGTRYERAPAADPDLWAALDRGEDPTA
ncbi:MAG TPA: Trp biosynthesis-associated membrane protein [Micromonosporaceae bacterium]|jgi:hypothetical protein|nr:Trp biosynthesis-associated membrane protein [Micromonosporaceae bacterium]